MLWEGMRTLRPLALGATGAVKTFNYAAPLYHRYGPFNQGDLAWRVRCNAVYRYNPVAVNTAVSRPQIYRS